MNDYKIFNDNGEERTWEELYEDNVLLQQENQKLKDKIIKLGLKLEDRAYEQLKQENQQLKIQVSAREEVVNQLQDRINMAKEYITKQLEQNEWEYYGRRILLEILGDNNEC